MTFLPELTENMGSMEMDHMAASFNTMIHRIQTMKIELYEKELQRTQLDLQCLQLQLSPHFFINTLNTIYFLSINEENLQLQSLTLEFMEYFRAVFKSSSSLIPLRKELEQCSHYISIQQVQKAAKATGTFQYSRFIDWLYDSSAYHIDFFGKFNKICT